jgi:hypothetical protein
MLNRKPNRLSLISATVARMFGGLTLRAFDPKDPDTAAAIAAAVDEAVGGLKAKNQELIGEVRKLKAGATVTPEQLQAVERERDELETKLGEVNKQLKAANTSLEATTKERDGEKAYNQRLLVDNGLNDALLAAGVKNPAHLKAAAALIRQAGQVEVKVEGENRSALIGGKPLAEFVKAWSQSDDGKHFVTAPDNSGGGAKGGTGKTPPTPENATLSPVERMHQAREATAGATAKT